MGRTDLGDDSMIFQESETVELKAVRPTEIADRSIAVNAERHLSEFTEPFIR